MADPVNPIQVQKFLKGIDYPADKKAVLDTARKQGADDSVLETLGRIADRSYDGPNAVSKEIGAQS